MLLNLIQKGKKTEKKAKLLIKIILGVILTMLCHISYPVQARGIEYDFRKTIWGMTKEEVKLSESGKLLKEVKLDEKEVVTYGFDEEIIYVGKTSSINVQIHYSFLNDHLIHAAYLLVEQYEDKNLYITAFDRLRETLIKNMVYQL